MAFWALPGIIARPRAIRTIGADDHDADTIHIVTIVEVMLGLEGDQARVAV